MWGAYVLQCCLLEPMSRHRRKQGILLDSGQDSEILVVVPSLDYLELGERAKVLEDR